MILTKSRVWEILGVLAFVVSIIVSGFIVFDPYTQTKLISYLEYTNWAIASFVIAFLSFLSIVAAPTSTSFIVYALVSVWDWHLVLIASLLGDTFGYVFAFQLSRRYQERIYDYLPWLKRFAKWEEKITKSNKVMHFTFLRLATLYIGDYISYIAGLTNMKFNNFVIASVIANTIYKTIFIYLLSRGLKSSQYIYVFILMTLSTLALWGIYTLYEKLRARASH